jgi:hypothetical protein
MTNLFKKFAATLLVTLLMVIQIPVVFGETAGTTSDKFQCEHLNNQKANSTDTGASVGYDDKGTAVNTTGSLASKLVVITEEPLGTADGKTTYLCARQITCTGKPVKAPAPRSPTTTTKSTPETKQPAASTTPSKPTDPAKPTYKRECVTTYVNNTSCSATSKSDIDTALGKPVVDGESFTLCEPVMVYVSPAGTALLYYYIGQIYRYMATLGGTIAVLILIVGGIMRASAGDNTERITKATAIITKCISGLVLLFLSAIILYAINPNFFVI